MTWLDQIYQAQGLNSGKPVRRSISSLPNYISPQDVLKDAHNRGFQAALIGVNIMIFR